MGSRVGGLKGRVRWRSPFCIRCSEGALAPPGVSLVALGALLGRRDLGCWRGVEARLLSIVAGCGGGWVAGLVLLSFRQNSLYVSSRISGTGGCSVPVGYEGHPNEVPCCK